MGERKNPDTAKRARFLNDKKGGNDELFLYWSQSLKGVEDNWALGYAKKKLKI